MSNVVETSPQIKNIKFHFTVNNIPQLYRSIIDIINDKLEKPTEDSIFKTGHNYIVYKKRFVYTIFYNKGYINCTKVPAYSHISKAIEEFCQIFRINRWEIPGGVKIDNTTSSGNFSHQLNLFELKNVIHENSIDLNTSFKAPPKFNPSYFPGLFLKYNCGTIILFHSGKYTIVGAKCQRHSEFIFNEVKKYIHLQDGYCCYNSRTNN